MAILKVWNVWTELTGTSDEVAWARDRLTFTYRGQRGRTKQECLLLTSRPLFPTGWVRSLLSEAKRANVRIIIQDQRRRPCPRDPDANINWLYDEQKSAIAAIDRFGQGMIDVGVGGGKGELIAACPIAFPCRWGVFVQDTGLVEMLRERYRKRAPPSAKPAGVIWGDRWEVGERLTIVSVATLDQHWRQDQNRWDDRARDFLESIDGIAVDEAHGSASATAMRILRATPRAWFRIGLSGTVVGRSDKRDYIVQGHFGPVIFRMTASELEQLGRTAQTQVVMTRCEQHGIPPYQEGGYEVGIVRSQVRNRLILRTILERPKPSLWFVKEIVHGEILLAMCRQAGLRAQFIQGDDADDVKEKAKRDLDQGILQVGIATSTWKQGIDITHLRAGGSAAGEMSPISTEQRRGRPVRVCHVAGCAICARDGKKDRMIWDDIYDDHPGVPSVQPGKLARHWLVRHRAARKRAYEEKGLQVVLR